MGQEVWLQICFYVKPQCNVRLSVTETNMPLLTFFIISHSLLHVHSTSGESHKKPKLQFDIPPAEGVNTAGLHPAEVREDREGAHHEHDFC